jgi:predicted transcriptional regulator
LVLIVYNVDKGGSMTTVSTRIDQEISSKLDMLAKTTDRSRSWLLADALRRYIDEESWQISAIEEGVREANAGNFASQSEVKGTFARWGVDAE